jgi:selenocysteine insertion sequence-binding protein 2
MCFTGGIDDLLHQIRAKCEEQKIPIVFALSRRGLGRAVLKKVPVSIVGVFNYDGAQEQFNELLSTVEDARRAYMKLVAEFDSETKRLEEAAKSGQSSSSGESSAVSSRKTSKTDSETDSVRSDRKISGTSDDGEWTSGGLSQLSASAPEFHPVPYQPVPPPWATYPSSPYEYSLSSQMLPMAGTQYYIAHPHGFVTSPPHMAFEGFQSQFQYMTWRDPGSQAYRAPRGARMDRIPTNAQSVLDVVVDDGDDDDDNDDNYKRSESENETEGNPVESQDGVVNYDDGSFGEEEECTAIEAHKSEFGSCVSHTHTQEVIEVEVEEATRLEGAMQEPLTFSEGEENDKHLEICETGYGQYEESMLQEVGSEADRKDSNQPIDEKTE